MGRTLVSFWLGAALMRLCWAIFFFRAMSHARGWRSWVPRWRLIVEAVAWPVFLPLGEIKRRRAEREYLASEELTRQMAERSEEALAQEMALAKRRVFLCSTPGCRTVVEPVDAIFVTRPKNGGGYLQAALCDECAAALEPALTAGIDIRYRES